MLGRRSVRGKGAWPLHARIGNRVLAAELRRRIGVPVTDLGPMRAARREALLALPMSDRRFGYPLEMVMRAARGRLADRRDRRAVLPADREVEGHRHARRHGADRAATCAGAASSRRPCRAPAQRRPGYTGKHRRAGLGSGGPGRAARAAYGCRSRDRGTPGADGTPGRTRRSRGPAGARPAAQTGPGPWFETGSWPDAGYALAAQVIVIAKEPVPGRVKTRLTPPYTPAEAAELAEAALADTLAAVASASVARRVLALAG